MPFLRPFTMVRSAALRPAFYTAPRARMQVRFATQDYGSGEGNPGGEKPQQQGANKSESLEHPGPPPPKVAEGQSSSSPNNNDTQQSSKSTSKSSGSEASSSSSSGKSTSDKEVKGAQPKILSDDSPPKEQQGEDVKKHNEEMDNRADRAHEKVGKDDGDDKVAPSFWAGQGGRGHDKKNQKTE